MTDQLILTFRTGPGHVVLTAAGECDPATCDQLRAALVQAVTPEARLLILDLSGMTFMDSSGLHALIDARASLAVTGHLLVLACVHPMVARILSLSGADQFIRVAATVEDALTGW